MDQPRSISARTRVRQPRSRPVRRADPRGVPKGRRTPASNADIRLQVDVAWADITKAQGDVYLVGHYIGVLPQNAEWAVDCALSGTRDESQLVLTDFTRRGVIRGALGDVTFFPWAGRGHIVLAGMGRLGTFKEAQLKTLARNVAQSVGLLLKGSTICSVLIGSGAGNLSIDESVSGLLTGFSEALAANPALQIQTLRIVEQRLDKAYEILEAARKRAGQIEKEHKIRLAIERDVLERDDAGGLIPVPFGFSLMLASLAQACRDAPNSPLRTSLDALVNELPDHLRADVLQELRKRGDERNRRRLGLAFRLGPEQGAVNVELADRVSFTHDGTVVRSAAITNMTTVAARDLDVRLTWVDRIVEELHAPLPEVIDERAGKAFRYLIHPELREKLQSQAPLVLELDRNMARVPWEMVHGAETLPLGVHRPVARQLRTAYSAQPADPIVLRRGLRALVIGDPDDSLDYARKEAQAVAGILKRYKIDVELRLGPPDELGLGKYKGIDAADLYEIVGLLQSGEFDLVHYSGHAFFFPEYPDRSGWQFKNELLTPSKLEGIDRPPRLIVANACVSARLSAQTFGSGPQDAGHDSDNAEKSSRETPARRLPGDSRLVASLADEFFRRGIADYIGTAWEVPEGPAMLFAEKFYEELLRDWQKPTGTKLASGRTTLGMAVQAARKCLYDKRAEWPRELSTVWAAYQHYGDPTRRFLE